MTQKELSELRGLLREKYAAAMQSFVNLDRQNRETGRVAAFVNGLKLTPQNGDVADLSTKLISDSLSEHPELQMAGFDDGVRWTIEALMSRDLLKLEE